MLIANMLLIVLQLFQAAPAEAGPPSGSGEGSCMESGCHAVLAEAKVVHGAVAAEMCDSCHEYSGAGHEFSLTAEPIGQICVGCHEDPREGHGVVHGAAAEGECTFCHDPHGSEAESLLIAQGAELCETCHDNPAAAGGSPHPPAAEGECLLCHDPHASDDPHLVREPVNSLCAGCHSGPEEELQRAAVHEIVRTGGCTVCHNPHASPSPSLLRAGGSAFCLECHGRQAADPGPEAPDRVALFDGRQVAASLLDGLPVITLSEGRGHPLAGHPVTAPENPRAPEEAFWCASCHEPHGGERKGLIRTGSWFGLCRECHKK